VAEGAATKNRMARWSPGIAGDPTGSAISPLLANLFMHYVFDDWMVREFPGIGFERYCDDAECTAAANARPARSTRVLSRPNSTFRTVDPDLVRARHGLVAVKPGQALVVRLSCGGPAGVT
jgi:hypothetical protein